MPFLANFDGIGQIGEFLVLLLCWPVAAGLALLALLLAIWPRTRRASWWCAIVCMVVSVPICLADGSLIVHRVSPFSGNLDPVLCLFLSLAPLGTAVAVFSFNLRHMKR